MKSVSSLLGSAQSRHAALMALVVIPAGALAYVLISADNDDRPSLHPSSTLQSHSLSPKGDVPPSPIPLPSSAASASSEPLGSPVDRSSGGTLPSSTQSMSLDSQYPPQEENRSDHVSADNAPDVQPPMIYGAPNMIASLPSNQVAIISEIAEEFHQRIGSSTFSPEDPRYLDTWTTAKAEADEHLRIQLGDDVFRAMSWGDSAPASPSQP